MKSTFATAGLAITVLLTVGLVTTYSQQPATRAAINKDTVDRWMKELSNWNRWGPTTSSVRSTS